MKQKHNRRKFLSIGGLLTGAALLAPVLKANALSKSTDEETVKLLTPDGKLVEVSKRIVQGARKGAKASNDEILNWTNVPKIKP